MNTMPLRSMGLLLFAACFAPSYREGSPCDDTHPCPSVLSCDPVSHTCVRDPQLTPDATCSPGFGYDGTACVDLDECTLATDDCAADATCANQAGGFSCACKPGFTGDGKTCARVCNSVLLFDDCPAPGTSCAGIPEVSFGDNAAVALGLQVKYGGIADEAAFRTLFDAGGFDVLIVESSRIVLDAATATRIAMWVAGGGKAIISFWDLDNDTTGQVIRTAAGVSTVGDISTPRDVVRDPASPVNLFDRLEVVTSPLLFTNVMADDGDELAVANGGGFLAARHTSVGGPGAIAVTRNDRVITLGFVPIGLTTPVPRDADADGKPDVLELYTNLIGFLCGY